MNSVFIVDSIRTPRARGNKKGSLSKLRPYDLLNVLYKDIEHKKFFNLEKINEVILGCVTQFGEQAGNIAAPITPAESPNLFFTNAVIKASEKVCFCIYFLTILYNGS